MSSIKSAFRIMILGDEDSDSSEFTSLVQDNYVEAEIFGVNNPADGSLQLAEEHQADVLLVKDGKTRGENLQFLKKLPKGFERKVVYVTESDESALYALKMGVRDVVLHPDNSEEVRAAINHVASKTKPQSSDIGSPYRNKLLINKIDRAVIIEISNILCFEADGPYTSFFMSDKTEVKSSKSMGYYQKLLSDLPNLIKVNRGVVVNFEHIQEIIKGDSNEGTLVLTTGKAIELSATMKNRLLHQISEILSSVHRF